MTFNLIHSQQLMIESIIAIIIASIDILLILLKIQVILVQMFQFTQPQYLILQINLIMTTLNWMNYKSKLIQTDKPLNWLVLKEQQNYDRYKMILIILKVFYYFYDYLFLIINNELLDQKEGSIYLYLYLFIIIV